MSAKRSIVTGSTFLWIIGFVAGGYLLLLLLMYIFQSAFVYFPTRSIVMTPADRSWEYEDVYLHTEDDYRLHGWYIPVTNGRGTVLFFHGNAGNISGRLESISVFRDLGLNVFIFDYRGYGKSEGSPSEKGTYKDAEAAWRFLTEVQSVPPDEIILFGRSLGGGIASWLGSNVSAGAVVLESTFTSAPDLAGELYPIIPARALMTIRYPVRNFLDDLAMPVMIAHSPQDDVIPYHHGKKLYELAGEPKTWLEMRGGHNDGFIQSEPEYSETWDRFIREHIEN